jgi:hypothetical protein
MTVGSALMDTGMEGSITLRMSGTGVDPAKIARVFPVGSKVTARFGDDGEVIQVMLVTNVEMESDPEGDENYENVVATINLESIKKERPRKKRAAKRPRRECADCSDTAEPDSDYCSDCG